MKTVAFVNAKGGAGKTTAALLFARALKESNVDVAIDDRDINQVASTTAPRLGLKVGTEAAYVIIDTAGYLHDPRLADVIRTADLVVIVLAPTPTDLMVTRGTAEYIRQQRPAEAKTVVLFTRVQGNRFGRVLDSFGKELHFPVLKNVLGHRTAYVAAQLDGWHALSKWERTEVIQLAIEIISLTLE
jgi:cellulose biosynthesis protein BcsQ